MSDQSFVRAMGAIFRRECSQWFRSPLAWSVLAIFAVLGGFYLTIDLSLYMGILTLELKFLASLFFIIIPLITMRSFAEERQLGTDKLLFTAPISTMSIVVGKYAAAAVLFLCMMLTTIPHLIIILSLGGRVDKITAFTYLNVILIGLVYLGIGLFISSLTNRQTIAALTTMVVLLILNVLNSTANVVGAFFAKVIGWLDVANLIDLSRQTALGDNIAAGIKWLNPQSRLELLSQGVFDLTMILYFVILIICLLYLTVQRLESRKWETGR
ncbi:MAG: ABC transporter permease subunit [Fastidiosipilaceae bacterium]|nr:ABC transporter permease subunit [Clostridiaceae bacterium]